MPTTTEMCAMEIQDAIKVQIEKTFNRHGDVDHLGENGVHFEIDEDGVGRPVDGKPWVAFDIEVQPLIDMVDVEQIGYGLDLDFKLRWGGPLVVDVAFSYDDRQRGFGQDQWETEVTVKLDGCSAIEYIEWLKHMSKNEQ